MENKELFNGKPVNMKNLVIALLIAVIFDMVLLPFCSNYLMLGSYESRYTNKSVRVDLFNRGGTDNALKILSDNKIWKGSKDRTAKAILIEDDLKSQWQEYKICAQVIQNGEVQVYLRGPDKKIDNERYPVLIDYRNLKINDESVFDEERSIWHDAPFTCKRKAQDGEVVSISFEARRHHFRISDITKVYHTNLWMLFTISVFSFFVSFKLINYVSNYNTLEHNSRVDSVFVCIFFALLFLPMCKINDAEKSDEENRMLAIAPKLFANTGGGYNLRYGADTEKWFNDRFFGREWAIKLDTLLKYKGNRVYKKGNAIYLADNNWMFNGNGLNIPNNREITEEIKQLNNLKNFTQKNNIKLYILLVPDKRAVYHEIMEDNYVYSGEDNKLSQYVDQLRKGTKIPIIHPYEELRKARHEDYVFFKQAHHWTDWGAYLGYQALMQEISRDFPDIKTVTLNDYKKFTAKKIRDDYNRDFNTGHTTRLLGFSPKFAEKNLLKEKYTYYDHKSGDNLMVNRTENIKLFSQAGGEYKILLTGNSQNENLLQFMPYSAQQLKYIRLNRGRLSAQEQNKFLKYYKKELLDFKPDILIYCMSLEASKEIILNITKD